MSPDWSVHYASKAQNLVLDGEQLIIGPESLPELVRRLREAGAQHALALFFGPPRQHIALMAPVIEAYRVVVSAPLLAVVPADCEMVDACRKPPYPQDVRDHTPGTCHRVRVFDAIKAPLLRRSRLASATSGLQFRSSTRIARRGSGLY